MSVYDKETVLLPIKVPKGKHCWNGINCCEHFDNYHVIARCELGFENASGIQRDENGHYLKPETCLSLRKQDD